MLSNKFSLTAANLKWIAIILMFVNHLCIVLNEIIGINNYFLTDVHWYITRIAFIIFAYQIAEGMYYTRNKKKYICGLFIFACISEICYDLCFRGTLLEFSDQNVLFNLVLGALAIYCIDKTNRKPIYIILITLASMIIGVLIHADYGSFAQVLIVSFYLFRQDKKKQLRISALVFILFCITDYMHRFASILGASILQTLCNPSFWSLNFIELHGLLAWPLFSLYKGEKGNTINKWFFYIFYPGHLLFLYVLWKIMI